MGFTNTRFISDHWHLFNQVFPTSFGIHLAEKLSPYLSGMVYANSEEQFDQAYFSCKNELESGRFVRGDYLEALQRLYDEKETYASYCISNITSSRGRRGSTSAEANHSSLIIHLNGRRGVNQYVEKPLTLIKDILQRQAQHILKWNKSLYDEDREMTIMSSKLSLLGEEKHLKDAADYLNKRSYKRFVKSWYRAKTDYVLVGGDSVQNVRSIDVRTRKFRMDDDGEFLRCGCKDQKGFEEQCVHEIVLHGCRFVKELFAPWHRRRTCVTVSPIPEDVGCDMDISDSIEDLVEVRNGDYEEEFDSGNFDNSALISTEDGKEVSLSSTYLEEKKATSFNVSKREFATLIKEILGNADSVGQDQLNKTFALLVEVNNSWKSENQYESELMKHKSIDNCFEKIIRSYKKTFCPRGRSFMPSSEGIEGHPEYLRTPEPSYQMQKRKPRKRLKSQHEIVVSRHNNRVKKKSAQHCSFCSSTSHKVNGCPKKKEYVSSCKSFILHLDCDDSEYEFID